jgi:hypothetical protein
MALLCVSLFVASLAQKGERKICFEARRTGFEGEGGDVDDDFWTGLEDDEEHADRARDAVEIEVVVQRARVRDGSGRVGEQGDVRDALQHRGPLVARAQVEALHERGRETPRGGFCFCVLCSVPQRPHRTPVSF